jgi:hypothetical protein
MEDRTCRVCKCLFCTRSSVLFQRVQLRDKLHTQQYLRTFWIISCVILALCGVQFATGSEGRASTGHLTVVPVEHPRLLGSREYLQSLAVSRPDAYKRVVAVARQQKADDHAKMISMSLVCAIENDEQLGKDAVQMAMKYVAGPIRQGHVTFAHDLARCAIVYDLCHEYWTQEQ